MEDATRWDDEQPGPTQADPEQGGQARAGQLAPEPDATRWGDGAPPTTMAVPGNDATRVDDPSFRAPPRDDDATRVDLPRPRTGNTTRRGLFPVPRPPSDPNATRPDGELRAPSTIDPDATRADEEFLKPPRRPTGETTRWEG